MAHPTRPILARPAAGFTLIEMLVVISIITLIVLIAIPSFRALTGGRSVEAASNNIAAIIGRARSEAIGLQRTTGVLFYMDQATDRVAAVIVREVPPPPDNNAPPGIIYLDMTPNGETTILPVGVGLNVFDSFATPAGQPTVRQDDGLIGFNPVFAGPNFTAPMAGTGRCGGAILFDGVGRLSSRPYRLLLNRTGNAVETTALAKLLASNAEHTLTTTMGKACSGRDSAGVIIETVSSVGFILFDLTQFRETSSVTPLAPANTTPRSYTATERDGNNGSLATMPEEEKSEEIWIDQNGTPFLVGRHSGGLMRNR